MLFATNNAERMTISNAGNVGIGTISPNANLHLHGNAASQNVRISFSDNTSGIATTDGFCIGKDGLQKAYIYNCENADIDFGTSNTERMRIMANGNIGIGTNSALSSLHLHKNALAQDVRMIISDNTSTSSLIRGLHLIKGGDHIGYLWNYENTPLILGTNNAERIRIAENGNVGIGTNDPAIYKCQVNGNLGATGNITAYYSDERLKNITEYVSDVLPALDKINVFKYNCNDLAESFGYDKSKKEIGLSAQEIQKFYPEIVSIAPFDADCDKETKQIISKSGENYLTLDYERLVPVLIQGIKELNNVTTSQNTKISELEDRLAKLEKIIGNN